VLPYVISILSHQAPQLLSHCTANANQLLGQLPQPRDLSRRALFDNTCQAAGTLHQLGVPLLTAVSSPPRGPVSPEGYGSSLAAAFDVMRRAHSSSTHDSRRRVAVEFSRFLLSLPARLAKDFTNATAYDVVVFLHSEWRPHHGRTLLPDGTRVASASGLGNAASALSAAFDVLGRRGEWDPTSNAGNPCESNEVRLYRAGYQRDLWSDDIEPVAAVPLEEVKLLRLVTHLDERREALLAALPSNGSRFHRLRALLLERDALLVTYLGASIQRGGEGARLRVCDIRHTGSGDGTVLQLPLGAPLSAIPDVTVYPNGVKTRQRRNCGHFTIGAHADPRLCFVQRYTQFQQSCRDLGQPLQAPAGFIFRIMDPHHRTSLAAAPLTVAAGLSRLRSGLLALGDYDGETMHSFRRAGMQSDQDSGLPPQVTMDRALITSPSTYSRYTNRSRPTKRVAPVELFTPGAL